MVCKKHLFQQNSVIFKCKIRKQKYINCLGKGAIDVSLRGYNQGYFNFTITFQSKDGRYRYNITDIYHDNPGGSSGGYIKNEKPECGTFSMTKKEWLKIKTQAQENIELLSHNLKDFLSSTVIKQDDW